MEKIKENDHKEELKVENVRLENYFKNNNCLTLLGFERAIFGEASTKEI